MDILKQYKNDRIAELIKNDEEAATDEIKIVNSSDSI